MQKLPKFELNERILQDLMSRSLIGIPMYCVLWLIVVFWPGFFRQHLVFSYGALSGFCVIALFRAFHWYRFRVGGISQLRLQYGLFVIGIILPAVVWSAAFCWVLIGSARTDVKILMVMATSGLCSGGHTAFAPDRRLAFGYMALLLLPATFLLLLAHRSDFPLAVLMAIFFGAMYLLGANTTRAYWTAMHDEARLREKNRQLARLSERDGLTGIYNRRYFDKVFFEEWKRASHQHLALSLILVDFDHFKKINDTYGHLAGDLFLKEATAVLRTVFKRNSDIIVRYGGEEFAILLPGVDTPQAVQLAETVRRKIEALRVPYQHCTIYTTTSVGIAGCKPDYHTSGDALFADADAALYDAKHQGRNQVQLKG